MPPSSAFSDGAPLPWAAAAPVWIVAMWIGFALTLNHSLSALKRHPGIAVTFGLVGGPLAYWIAAGVWQAARIEGGWLPYVALAVSWGAITPLLLRLADRLASTTRPAPAAA